jgi:hypothetical protein
MVLTFDANGGGSFMTGDLNMKLARESTSTLSALNLPWYFEKEPDDYFYLAGSMNWSPIMSLNATLPTSMKRTVTFSLSFTNKVYASPHNVLSVKAALRAIQFRSTIIGQGSILISLSIQGEHDS